MTHAAVTVEYDNGKRIDLALPLNISSHILANAVAESLKIDIDGQKSHQLSVKIDNSLTRIPAQSTLGDMGILDGTVLQLGIEKSPQGRTTDNLSRKFPVLLDENGRAYVLEAKSLLVGRNDLKRGWKADLDLSPIDPQKIVSRRHARLEKQGARWTIEEDSVCKNGTWLNGHRLSSGESYPLQDGDEIIFGKNGVVMRFQSN